ncbi:hypothetical protein NHX12_017684 [Muraenolepis orangiensis]|uniref:Inositol 1,4,5-trisphosphate receptor-interacting protein n=1 Tax=Muraenolepis orangiensis TaxID=630683 RepID=A0A9Q0EWZ5_9TELE|nr:hypothetical protein NHX12_017684 [Muraenolepis orangiensis]
MQGPLLRVLTVTLGLILYPTKEPGVEEWAHMEGLEEHHGLMNEAMESYTEIPFNNKVPTTNSKANLGVSQEEASEATLSSSGPDSFLSSEDSRSEKELEDNFLWYIRYIFSAISLVHFLRKILKRNSIKFVEDWIQSDTTPRISSRVRLPDSNTLHLFHDRFVKESSAKMWRTGAFLEGLTHDLLEVMRITSGERAGIVMEDFIQTESGCDIVVPLVPPEPYVFQCRLWSTSEDGMQGCGKIHLEKVQRQNGCHCGSSNVQDDMVCLLHQQFEKLTRKHSTDVYSLICMRNTTFISKAKVTKWFMGTIRTAWEQISHKYEFELCSSKTDTPGALLVRFRSGRTIHFTLNPVVKLNNTTAFFSTTPCSTNVSDISWPLSVNHYEDNFLKGVCKTLPEHGCHSKVLDILSFLHQKQTTLTGNSALKDFHFKNVLMELLLSTDPSQWHPKNIDCRLRDLLVLMEKKLGQRLLHHALVGNPLAQHIDLPAELSQAERVNLFHPLVVQDCIYNNTLMHFHELLRNSFIQIQDYMESECI